MGPEISQSYSAMTTTIAFQGDVNGQIQGINAGKITIRAQSIATGEGAGPAPAQSSDIQSPATLVDVSPSTGKATGQFLHGEGRRAANNAHTATVANDLTITIVKREVKPEGFFSWLLTFLRIIDREERYTLTNEQNTQVLKQLNNLDYAHYAVNDGEIDQLITGLNKLKSADGASNEVLIAIDKAIKNLNKLSISNYGSFAKDQIRSITTECTHLKQVIIPEFSIDKIRSHLVNFKDTSDLAPTTILSVMARINSYFKEDNKDIPLDLAVAQLREAKKQLAGNYKEGQSQFEIFMKVVSMGIYDK